MLNGNVDEWPVSCFGKVTERRGVWEEVGKLGVEEREMDPDEITGWID